MHPLVEPLAAQIHESAARAERERRIPDELIEALKGGGLFSLYTAERFGGMDLSLTDALAVVEDAARCDGSTGWTVALAFSNQAFAAMLPEAGQLRVLSHGPVLIAGSVGFRMRAVAVEGGYRVTGQYPYVSGAPNADWHTVLAPVFDGDRVRPGAVPGGMPEMALLFLSPAETQIIDTWHVSGLRASGTQDVRIKDVFVPSELSAPVTMAPGRAVGGGTLGRIPFQTMLSLVQSPAVCLGIGRHVIEAFMALAQSKQSMPGAPRLAESAAAQTGLAKAEALVGSGRAFFYQAANRAWQVAKSGEAFTPEVQAHTRLGCLTAVENAVEAVDLLFRLGGSTSIFESGELERCWRDVHAAAQHTQVQDMRWEAAGKALFGIPSPMV